MSLLGFTSEIKKMIDQLNLPEGGQKEKKKFLEGNNSNGSYWRTDEEGSWLLG